MMTMITTALLLALQAPSQAPTAKPGEAAAQPAEKKLCRPMPITGSLMPARRVCRTVSEWKTNDKETNEAFEAARYSRNRSTTNGPGSPLD